MRWQAKTDSAEKKQKPPAYAEGLRWMRGVLT